MCFKSIEWEEKEEEAGEKEGEGKGKGKGEQHYLEFSHISILQLNKESRVDFVY